VEFLESLISRNLPFLAGGVIIGIAASGLLWLNGRIAGISGIIGGLLDPSATKESWRIAFLLGLLTAGLLAVKGDPESLGMPPENRSIATLCLAGLLIGVGTGLARGCTSGHGICGLARLSRRALIATLTFMATGILTATVFAQVWATS